MTAKLMKRVQNILPKGVIEVMKTNQKRMPAALSVCLVAGLFFVAAPAQAQQDCQAEAEAVAAAIQSVEQKGTLTSQDLDTAKALLNIGGVDCQAGATAVALKALDQAKAILGL